MNYNDSEQMRINFWKVSGWMENEVLMLFLVWGGPPYQQLLGMFQFLQGYNLYNLSLINNIQYNFYTKKQQTPNLLLPPLPRIRLSCPPSRPSSPPSSSTFNSFFHLYLFIVVYNCKTSSLLYSNSGSEQAGNSEKWREEDCETSTLDVGRWRVCLLWFWSASVRLQWKGRPAGERRRVKHGKIITKCNYQARMSSGRAQRMLRRATRWCVFLVLSMRLEVRTQTAISSLRKQSTSVRVTVLQNYCSWGEQRACSSGRGLTSWRRVSSLTQLFILPLISAWQRQNRLTLHPSSVLLRAKILSTTCCDFPRFWMKDRMSLMMLGTTFLFSNCWDFFDFLQTQTSGWQSSSLEMFLCF